MRRLVILLFLSLASNAAAQTALDRLMSSTEAAFPRVPSVVVTSDITSLCGGNVVGPAVYCTSDNRIYLAAERATQPQVIYEVAHLYGHALQVRYGVADIALAAITANRGREAELRGMVTRQVECLAGMLIARSGHPPIDLSELFDNEPMTGSHWGRNPVSEGPRVSIGLAARAQRFAAGYAAASPRVCSVDEMSADLIISADQF